MNSFALKKRTFPKHPEHSEWHPQPDVFPGLLSSVSGSSREFAGAGGRRQALMWHMSVLGQKQVYYQVGSLRLAPNRSGPT